MSGWTREEVEYIARELGQDPERLALQLRGGLTRRQMLLATGCAGVGVLAGLVGTAGAGELAPAHSFYQQPVYQTAWFNLPVDPSGGSLAPTPGTADADAMSEYGQIRIDYHSVIRFTHLHQIKDGSSGTNTLELWRQRSGVRAQIGSISLAQGGGDFTTNGWTITDDRLQPGDYVLMQPTARIVGGRGFVDMHLRAIG